MGYGAAEFELISVTVLTDPPPTFTVSNEGTKIQSKDINMNDGYALPDFGNTGTPCAVTKTIIHTDSENSYSELELDTTTGIVRPQNQGL